MGLRPVRAGIEGDQTVADSPAGTGQKSYRQPRAFSRGGAVLAFTPAL